MEYKYVVTVAFQQPIPNQELGYLLVTRTQGLGYQKYKEALEAFKKFSRRKVIEINTEVGKLSFNVVSVELLNVKKAEEQNNLTEEKQEEKNNGREESEGIQHDANNKKSDGENESQT